MARQASYSTGGRKLYFNCYVCLHLHTSDIKAKCSFQGGCRDAAHSLLKCAHHRQIRENSER